MKNSGDKHYRGFTLIELLVAVAIFALLTAIAIVSYTTVNRRARDGKRKADLEQVRTALEIYRTDNAAYPAGSFSAMIGTLTSPIKYLTTVPADPKGYSYYYSLSGSSYYLCAYLESGGPGCGGASCAAPGSCNYRVDGP